MAKDKISDYSATAASNTDVGGVNIQGTAAISNADDALREILSHLKDMSAGTFPVEDTFTVADPVDLTKRARLDAGGVTAGQTRVLASPNFDGTIATLAGTETLSGKTLTSPAINDQTATGFTGYPIQGLLHGLTLSNNVADATNDIDIAIGTAASIDTVPVLMTLTGALTKRLDAAWAVGTNAGGRMSAAAITDTTYHVWLIRRPDTGVVDVGFDVSATAPTMPANYTQKRRIGSIMRISASIKGFKQYGDTFIWDEDTTEFSLGADQAWALDVITIPIGIVVSPLMSGYVDATTGYTLISIGDATDTGAVNKQSIAATTGGVEEGVFHDVFSNTSGEIHTRFDEGTTGAGELYCRGFKDTRGRLA